MSSRVQRTSSVAAFADSFFGDPGKVQLIAELFDAFGSGGDGGLSPVQLRQVLSSMHAHCSAADVQALHARLDVDSDGLVTQHEFIQGLKCLGDPGLFFKQITTCHNAGFRQVVVIFQKILPLTIVVFTHGRVE